MGTGGIMDRGITSYPASGGAGTAPQSNAEELAYDIMRTILEFANTAVGESISLANSVTSLATIPDVTIPSIISDPIDFNKSMDALAQILDRLPSDPTTIAVDLNTPAAPDLVELPDIESVEIPEFTATAPSLNFPEQPTMDEHETPTADEINYTSPPSRSNYTMPTEPTLAAIEIPSPLSLDIPTFDATLISEDLLAPTNTFSFSEESYTSALQTAIQSGLLDMVQNGDYGLDQLDEDRLFQRAREREQLVANDQVNEAIRTFSESGFTMPPGAALKAVERARQDFLNKTSSINRDLVLKRADLYWEGKKFSYTEARELETVLMNYSGALAERALNAAKAEVQVGIDLFNSQVAAFTARQERYKVEAAVFAERVRGEIAKVELYKGQIDGARAQVDVNRSQIDLYNARLEAIEKIVTTYRVDVEAYNVVAQVERMKIEIYRIEVEAYAARVQANKAEFEAYEAAVRGEVARVEAYKAEAEAYRAQVDGKKAQVDAIVADLNAFIEKNRGLIDIYRAEAEVTGNLRDAQLAYNKNQVDIYQAESTQFAAEADAITKAYALSQSAEDAEYRAQIAVLQANTQNAQVQLQRLVEIAKLNMDATKTRADTYRSLAAGALSAMNCNASLSEGVSWSSSVSDNMSISHSTSQSENTSTSASTQDIKSVSESTSESVSVSQSTSTQVSDVNSRSTVKTDSTSTSENVNENYNYEG